MKRILAGVLAASALALQTIPAFATLAYQYAGSKYGKVEYFSAYITSTALDTTDPVNGKVIDNKDGRISMVACSAQVSDKTGTSPTINLILQGSHDGTNFYTVPDSGGTGITSGATSISGSGSGTTVVVGPIDTTQEGRTIFPPLLRVQADLGGTSPGWTGVVGCFVYRGNN